MSFKLILDLIILDNENVFKIFTIYTQFGHSLTKPKMHNHIHTLDCLIHILTILGEQNKEGTPQGDKLEQKILMESFSNDTLYVVLVSIKRNNTLWNSSSAKFAAHIKSSVFSITTRTCAFPLHHICNFFNIESFMPYWYIQNVV